MSMSVNELPESTRNAILDGELRKMWNRYTHKTYPTGFVHLQDGTTLEGAEYQAYLKDHPELDQFLSGAVYRVLDEDDFTSPEAVRRREESAAIIDNIVAITVPDLTALKIAVKTNTSMTNFKDMGLQRHLWIEAMKERWQ